MPTRDADKTLQPSRILERKQIKRLFLKLSTVPVPESKPSRATRTERPAYLRYIEYV